MFFVCYVDDFRVQFENILSYFSIVSTAPSWTFVFCSMPAIMMVDCVSVANCRGYKTDIYVWNKPDLCGQSHQGGARQATSSEYIVVVYKHEDSGSSTLSKHFSLLYRKEKLAAKLAVRLSY